VTRLAERVAVWPVLAASVRRSFLEQTSELTPLLLQLIGMGMGLLSQAFLGRLVDAAPNSKLGSYTGHYATFLLLGMALLDLQNAVVGGLARRIREAQLTGSLEGLLATPTPTPVVLLALALPDTIGALLRMLLYALVGRLLFGMQFDAINVLGVAVVLAAALAGFAAFTLVGAALTMALRRADPLNLLLAATSMIAGGVFYPRGILPHWLALLGNLLPIAPALDGLRAAIVHSAGPLAPSVTGPLARLGLLVLVVGPLGAWLFAKMVARAKHEGSLTAF